MRHGRAKGGKNFHNWSSNAPACCTLVYAHVCVCPLVCVFFSPLQAMEGQRRDVSNKVYIKWHLWGGGSGVVKGGQHSYVTHSSSPSPILPLCGTLTLPRLYVINS
ncbi:unnamed protein product [Discosporangium mesarthrocarpum]